MRLRRLRLASDENGAAAVEMALALPILIVMIWVFVQLAQIYRAIAGIQQALGQGARFATSAYRRSMGATYRPVRPSMIS